MQIPREKPSLLQHFRHIFLSGSAIPDVGVIEIEQAMPNVILQRCEYFLAITLVRISNYAIVSWRQNEATHAIT